MIVLNTNIVSEAIRPAPEPSVVPWLDRQAPRTLFTTSITAAELRLGAALVPDGRRYREIAAAVASALALFDGRVLPFDSEAATHFADRVAGAGTRGRPVSTADGQIGAIAAAHGFAVATRDTRPFVELGVDVIDPFQDR